MGDIWCEMCHNNIVTLNTRDFKASIVERIIVCILRQQLCLVNNYVQNRRSITSPIHFTYHIISSIWKRCNILQCNYDEIYGRRSWQGASIISIITDLAPRNTYQMPQIVEENSTKARSWNVTIITVFLNSHYHCS